MKKITLIAAAATTAVILTGSLVLVGWGSLRALTRKTPAPITTQRQGAAAVPQRAGEGVRQGEETRQGGSDQPAAERQYPNAGEAVTARQTLQGAVEVGTDTSNDIVGSGPE